MKEIERKIKESVEKFNKYRSPEAVAKLLSFGQKNFKIEFSGPFCRTCGFHDYFDDYKIFLEELGAKTEIRDVDETGDGAIVKLEIL